MYVHTGTLLKSFCRMNSRQGLHSYGIHEAGDLLLCFVNYHFLFTMPLQCISYANVCFVMVYYVCTHVHESTP